MRVMNNITEQMIQEVNSYLARTGMAPSTFGREAVGDWRFVKRLRAGDDFRVSTIERVRDFINDAQPSAAPGGGAGE